MRLFVLVRHGQSELNATRRVNGDPYVPVGLTAQGEAEAGGLALQVAGIELDLCVHTRFGRRRATARIAVEGRDIADRGRAAARRHRRRRARGQDDRRLPGLEDGAHAPDAFPGGESLDDSARRYADAYERLLARPERRILVVCHEIPVRYALNAAAGSDELDGPAHEIGNCVPHLFDENGLARAVERIRALAPR